MQLMREQDTAAKSDSCKKIKVLACYQLFSVTTDAIKHLFAHHLTLTTASTHAQPREQADVCVVDHVKEPVTQLLLSWIKAHGACQGRGLRIGSRAECELLQTLCKRLQISRNGITVNKDQNSTTRLLSPFVASLCDRLSARFVVLNNNVSMLLRDLKRCVGATTIADDQFGVMLASPLTTKR